MVSNNNRNYSHTRYMEDDGIQLLVRDAGVTFMGMGGLFTVFDLLVDQNVGVKNLVAIGIGALLFKTGNHFIDRQNDIDKV